MSRVKNEKGELVDHGPNFLCYCCGCGFFYTYETELQEGQHPRCPYCGSLETRDM